MARPKKYPDYNPKQVMQELINTVVALYGAHEHPTLATMSDELGLNPMKIRKLLITAGKYKSRTADQVLKLWKAGKTVKEIMCEKRMSRASVHSYLPYTKMAYKGKEISTTAERIKKYRERKKAVDKLMQEMNNDCLWAAITAFQGYPFKTRKGLKFTYKVKGEEICVDRKEKSITKSSVELAYKKVVGMERNVPGSKKPGVFGASYLYPVFVRLGVIQRGSKFY